jgi:signal transduction histidine kinase
VNAVNDHLGAALVRRRYLISAWPWRALAYLATSVPIGGSVMVGLIAVALPWLVLARGLRTHTLRPAVAVPLLVACAVGAVVTVVTGPPLAIGLAALERRRLRIVDSRAIRSAHRPAHGLDLVRTRLIEAATWREVAYAVFLGAVVPVGYGMLAVVVALDAVLIASPFLLHFVPISAGFIEITSVRQSRIGALIGVLALPALAYLLGGLATGQSAIARSLLGEDDSTAVREVARSRGRLVDAYEAERRRIERDLHDGAQHRLTSLTLQIGLARLDVPDDSPAAGPLDQAHGQAKQLMVVLRDLIHGLRPPSLTELGLPGALRELATASAIPVRVNVSPQWSGRPPERVESVAYFVASEALTNVVKHSRARAVEVTLTRRGDTIAMEIRDNGRGGADPAGGTGLTGLADRVAAVDGRLLLASPAGGPTVVRVELPC